MLDMGQINEEENGGECQENDKTFSCSDVQGIKQF